MAYVLVIDLTSMATSLEFIALFSLPKIKREKLDVRKPLKGGELLLKSKDFLKGRKWFSKRFFWLDGSSYA